MNDNHSSPKGRSQRTVKSRQNDVTGRKPPRTCSVEGACQRVPSPKTLYDPQGRLIIKINQIENGPYSCQSMLPWNPSDKNINHQWLLYISAKNAQNSPKWRPAHNSSRNGAWRTTQPEMAPGAQTRIRLAHGALGSGASAPWWCATAPIGTSGVPIRPQGCQ